MAPNSETSDCEAVRTEGVTRGVTGVTNSHSVADTKHASAACVGPCRPDVNSEAVTSNQARLGLSPEGAEAVQRRNALYPIHPSRMALISRPVIPEGRAGYIHPSRMALITRPEGDTPHAVQNGAVKGPLSQTQLLVTRSGSVLFWSLHDANLAVTAGSLMARIADWRPETLLIASIQGFRHTQGLGSKRTAVEDGLAAYGYLVEVVVSSSGRSLLFATMVPLLRQIRTVCPNGYSCIIEAHRKDVTIIGVLAPGWDTSYDGGSSAGTEDVNAVHAHRASFEEAMLGVVRAAQLRKSSLGDEIPMVLMGDMQISVRQDLASIPNTSQKSMYRDETACQRFEKTLDRLQLKDVFMPSPVEDRARNVVGGHVTYFPSERCRALDKGLKLDYLMVSEDLMAEERQQGLCLEEAHNQFFGQDSLHTPLWMVLSEREGSKSFLSSIVGEEQQEESTDTRLIKDSLTLLSELENARAFPDCTECTEDGEILPGTENAGVILPNWQSPERPRVLVHYAHGSAATTMSTPMHKAGEGSKMNAGFLPDLVAAEA